MLSGPVNLVGYMVFPSTQRHEFSNLSRVRSVYLGMKCSPVGARIQCCKLYRLNATRWLWECFYWIYNEIWTVSLSWILPHTDHKRSPNSRRSSYSIQWTWYPFVKCCRRTTCSKRRRRSPGYRGGIQLWGMRKVVDLWRKLYEHFLPCVYAKLFMVPSR